MNDNAKKWVEALRSGRFKQGKFRLTTILSNGAEFDCCLGVACKVFVEENPGLLKVEKHTVGFEDHETISHLEYNGDKFSLPLLVKNWLGMTTGCGQYGDDGYSLSTRNDGDYTFEQIAALIEAKQDDLFVKEVK